MGMFSDRSIAERRTVRHVDYSRTRLRNMPTERNGDQKQKQGASTLSPEFLSGGTEAGLEKIRTRLLDLTNRNKLLNFRHSTASTMRVVNVDPDAVFRKLIDGQKLSFLPVPEPVSELVEFIKDDTRKTKLVKPVPTDHAKEVGWEVGYDLDDLAHETEVDELPVLHYLDGLDTLTRKIGSAARTAIEESGTNMLYLVFGFLEWYESEDSQQPRFAPLLTLPVTLERAGGGKGLGFQRTVEYSGDDLSTNLSLVEKLRRDFGLEMPSLADEDTPDSYFENFSALLKQKKRWKIRRQLTLSLLSFGKLLMYLDLDPKTWQAGTAISAHPIVKELFEGKKSEDISHAEEYPIDDPMLKPDVPNLIVDADSSQHSALIHALRGQNLVIEGPPGTGKSQTITNLIAAALVKGKTVLFVSEKLAALEVVRRRLDSCQLGVFCLELHSHKTKKDSLLNDLERRIKARKSFRDPRELDQQFAVVDDKKKQLTKYANLVNQQIDPLQSSVFEIVWARDQAFQALSCDRDLLHKVVLPVAMKYSRADFAMTERFLEVYARHLTAVQGACDELSQHPWAWIRRPLHFAEEERLLNLATGLCQAIRSAVEYCVKLESNACIQLNGTLAGLSQSAKLLAMLPSAVDSIQLHLLGGCRDAGVRSSIELFIRRIEDANTARQAIREAMRDGGESLLALGDDRTLRQATAKLAELGFEHESIAGIRMALAKTRQIERELADSQRLFREVVTTLGCEVLYSANCLDLALETAQIIESAPFEVLHLRRPGFKSDGSAQVVRAASESASALLQEQIQLEREFDVARAVSDYRSDDLTRHARVIEESGLWQRVFGSEYRKAKDVHQRLAVNREKRSRGQMSRALRQLAEHINQLGKFESNPVYGAMLEDEFNGLKTKWPDLLTVAAWYNDVFVRLPDHYPEADGFRLVLFEARLDRLRSLKIAMGNMSAHRDSLLKARETLTTTLSGLPLANPLDATTAIEDLVRNLHEFNQNISSAVAVIEEAGAQPDISPVDVDNCLVDVKEFRECRNAVQKESETHRRLGHSYDGLGTNVTSIRATLQFANAIDTGGLPEGTVAWLLGEDCIARLHDLRDWLLQVNQLLGEAGAMVAELAEIAGGTAWTSAAQEPVISVLKRVTGAISHRDDLTPWSHFVKMQGDSRDASLDRLTTLADRKIIEPTHLVPAFRYCFYNSLARGVFSEHPELSELSGLTQEELRKQFAKADKQTIRLFRERAASIIDQRPVPSGNQGGPVGSWTEAALIVHEISKQKRHIPIRQLVRRSARALQALKPCFMMGPLSVAQYLAPGQLKFDLLVMDEASQLKPEDAIGAIARSGQIVIVGDSMQLPPTSFFQRVSGDSEDENDDERAVVEEGESILDVVRTLYQPVRRLRWHYRSQHHSLIAFSNQEFYQKDLIVFPSSHHDVPGLGVKYRAVEGGICENSRNPREASVVVDAVLEHMKDFPNETLGVVALNFEQRELIEELLDQRMRTDPFAVEYQERMNAGPERFFIKNLENVQGDERDVIFISTTYGPDSRGNQYQRFGPINGANGHRRLNVLFTRAKKRTVVFTSLEPDKINAGDGGPRGVRVLKQYLTFARSGIVEGAVETGDQPTNDFERSVGAVLNEKGYEVVPQVGVAGFFIDLAVRHPTKPGTFLLGIECDGAGYHSGRSARDRDRLRQEILENLGWKIHRVWSTDWFKSRDTEVKRLLSRVQDLLAADPQYMKEKEKEKAREIDSLRKRLIDLRELEIKPAFPDSPPEIGLLRKTLLDEFIRRRPTTKEEWFRKIHEDLRMGTEPEQVGRFLTRVLELIQEMGPDS